MQNVEQFNRFPAFPQLPSELRSQVAGFQNVGYPSAIAVDAFHGQYRQMTPPLETQAGFPCHQGLMQTQQLPTPPASPDPFVGYSAHRQPHPQQQQQQQHFEYSATNNWSPSYLPEDRLKFRKVLGSGAYGVVHLAEDATTGVQYAVKALNKFMPNGSPLDQRQQQFQQTEMRLHYSVSAHPNIVSLLRIKDTPEHTHVIMDYCPEGDLFSNITEKGRYVGDDVAAKNVFLQILDAVAYCHNRGVYHRDLKPENILVTEGGAQVKLADFGLATTEAYATEFGCGSTFYMSPECQDQHSGMPYYACAPNDIWSLGVILVNLTCGRNPWKSASSKDSTFRAYMEDRQFLKSILPLSDELNAILGLIFEMDPSRRIQLDQLRQLILHCPQFTKSPQYVDTPIYDDDFYDAPLSPASTISDEGSMISDHSDNSTVPSELDTPFEDDLPVEVMEDDSDACLDAEYHDCNPDTKGSFQNGFAKTWIPGPCVTGSGDFQQSSNQYVTACHPTVVDSGIYQVSQGPEQISSHVPTGFAKPSTTTQPKTSRPSLNAVANEWPATDSCDKASSTRAPARYIPQQQWSRFSGPRFPWNHTLAPRISTFV